MYKQALFFCAFFLMTLPLCAQTTVIKAGHMFDARSGKMLDNQIIIIEGGKIKEIGSNLKYSKEDKIIFADFPELKKLVKPKPSLTLRKKAMSINSNS